MNSRSVSGSACPLPARISRSCASASSACRASPCLPEPQGSVPVSPPHVVNLKPPKSSSPAAAAGDAKARPEVETLYKTTKKCEITCIIRVNIQRSAWKGDLVLANDVFHVKLVLQDR